LNNEDLPVDARTWFGHNRRLVLAVALWLGGIGAMAIAIAFLPEGACEYENHDAFVAAENRGGPFALAAATLVGVAAIALFVDAVRTRGVRRLLTAIGGMASLAVASMLALAALAALIHFSCLD
jgi:hypothetical protein